MCCNAFPKMVPLRLCQLSLKRSFRYVTTINQEGFKNEHSTIDGDDIKLYNELADKWWEDRGDMKGLHALNKLRVQLIRDGLLNTGQLDLAKWQSSRPLQGLKILDVGCGGGILSEPLARIGAEVTGIDASQNMIDRANLHAQKDTKIGKSVTYICATIEEHMNEHKDFYNAVVASEVLEHVTHKDLFLEACVSTLKPGGSIFITTLNRTLLMWAAGIVMAEYVLGLVPKGTHELNKCVKPHEVQALLERYGCSTKLVHGMMYNFLSNEWFWSPNTNINYALQAVRKY
ncbi:ubiquinone biosynthesis O-methyltransferase, mitochondrial-like [Periplaneta americana]|uniref:ubiquinone biosynthesis O-methyltransferase, mitochondrial-like n=1 Tax=Periplaneta americana TaxID=6978 RepID=UPI0037E9B80A